MNCFAIEELVVFKGESGLGPMSHVRASGFRDHNDAQLHISTPYIGYEGIATMMHHHRRNVSPTTNNQFFLLSSSSNAMR